MAPALACIRLTTNPGLVCLPQGIISRNSLDLPTCQGIDCILDVLQKASDSFFIVLKKIDFGLFGFHYFSFRH